MAEKGIPLSSPASSTANAPRRSMYQAITSQYVLSLNVKIIIYTLLSLFIHACSTSYYTTTSSLIALTFIITKATHTFFINFPHSTPSCFQPCPSSSLSRTASYSHSTYSVTISPLIAFIHSLKHHAAPPALETRRKGAASAIVVSARKFHALLSRTKEVLFQLIYWPPPSTNTFNIVVSRPSSGACKEGAYTTRTHSGEGHFFFS